MFKFKSIFFSILIFCCIISLPTHTQEATTELSKILEKVDYWTNYWVDYYNIKEINDIFTQRKITKANVSGLVVYLIHHESRFKINSKSWEKKTNGYSYGLMRLLPTTAKWLGWKGKNTKELLEINRNIKLGIKYLCWQIKRYKSLKKAVAAYNAGSARYTSKFKTRYINQHYVNEVYHYGYVAYQKKI